MFFLYIGLASVVFLLTVLWLGMYKYNWFLKVRPLLKPIIKSLKNTDKWGYTHQTNMSVLERHVFSFRRHRTNCNRKDGKVEIFVCSITFILKVNQTYVDCTAMEQQAIINKLKTIKKKRYKKIKKQNKECARKKKERQREKEAEKRYHQDWALKELHKEDDYIEEENH